MLAKANAIQKNIDALQAELNDSGQEIRRISPVFGRIFQDDVRRQADIYTDAIAPLLSPAIREQIRNNRDDMIAALYPIIGQTISKAVAEAIRDLRQRIDASLQQSFQPQQRLAQFLARLRGVSAADMLIRDALPYKITHVFLIHRQSGLLIQQLAESADMQDMDLISGLLTAIVISSARPRHRDSDLEEIDYGGAHILIKTAVCLLAGGAGQRTCRLRGACSYLPELNLEFETACAVSPEIGLPADFTSHLRPLLYRSRKKAAAASAGVRRLPCGPVRGCHPAAGTAGFYLRVYCTPFPAGICAAQPNPPAADCDRHHSANADFISHSNG